MTKDQRIYVFRVYMKGHYSNIRLKEIFKLSDEDLQSIIKEFGVTA